MSDEFANFSVYLLSPSRRLSWFPSNVEHRHHYSVGFDVLRHKDPDAVIWLNAMIEGAVIKSCMSRSVDLFYLNISDARYFVGLVCHYLKVSI